MLNLEQKRERDMDFGRIHTIKSVDEYEDFYTISTTDNTGFSFSSEYGVKPSPGDTITLYTHQGSMIHGIDLNGKPVYYRTKLEIEKDRERFLSDERNRRDKKFEDERDILDDSYEKLPGIFQRRIKSFRSNNSRFRQDFESYEMSVCTDAIKLAAWAREYDDPGKAIQKFQKFSYDKQKEIVPELAYNDHSGNSFGCVIRLAFHFVTIPENVYQEHGALVPLVGCKEYGCVHPR